MKTNGTRERGQKEMARSLYNQWRQLRDVTVSHGTLCDCTQCSSRRRVGARIELPYAGAPASFKIKEKK